MPTPQLTAAKLLLSFLAVLLLAGTSAALEPGETAPEFSLEAGPGDNVTLSEYQGKIIYLDFWASWCPPCRVSLPWMNKLQAKYGERGLQIIAVNVDRKRADAEKLLEPIDPGFVVAYDAAGAVPQRYGIPGMPSWYLIGRDGKIISIFNGYREVSEEEIESMIDAHLSDAL